MEEHKNRWAWLKRKENNFFLPFVIVVTVGVLLWVVFISKSSVVNWVKGAAELSRQERLIKKYNAEIQEMDEEIAALEANRDSLEKFGRENFHLAAPGDDVYVIE